MVQILDRVPSFGEKLAPTLAQAVSDVAKGYSSKRINEQDNRIIEGLTSNANASPMEQIRAFSSLSKDKQSSLSPLFSQMLQTQQKQQESQLKVQQDIAKEDRKIEAAKNLKDESKQETLQSANSIVDELQKNKQFVGHAFGHKPLQQKKQEIDTSAIVLEGLFRDLATKGTLSAKVFGELLNRLPNSKMTERQYQGALDGIRNILKAQGLKIPEEERPSLESFYQ